MPRQAFEIGTFRFEPGKREAPGRSWRVYELEGDWWIRKGRVTVKSNATRRVILETWREQRNEG